MERTTPAAHLTVVRVPKSTSEYATMDDFDAWHLAFVVDDVTFDAILSRIRAIGLEHSADSNHHRTEPAFSPRSGRHGHHRAMPSTESPRRQDTVARFVPAPTTAPC